MEIGKLIAELNDRCSECNNVIQIRLIDGQEELYCPSCKDISNIITKDRSRDISHRLASRTKRKWIRRE